jgi:hypothetical protein
MDKISVVIPVKNEEEKIEQCREAVFSQSLKLHEVIVVDGHSTDRTVERSEQGFLILSKNSTGIISDTTLYGFEIEQELEKEPAKVGKRDQMMFEPGRDETEGGAE